MIALKEIENHFPDISTIENMEPYQVLNFYKEGKDFSFSVDSDLKLIERAVRSKFQASYVKPDIINHHAFESHGRRRVLEGIKKLMSINEYKFEFKDKLRSAPGMRLLINGLEIPKSPKYKQSRVQNHIVVFDSLPHALLESQILSEVELSKTQEQIFNLMTTSIITVYKKKG